MASHQHHSVLSNASEAKPVVLKVLKEIMAHEHAQLYFNAPVDAEALGIPEYYKEIKRPMDLGTIRKKVLNHEYREVHEVYDDIRLVWRNCLKFNEADSPVSADCLVLKGIAEQKWKKANLARGHSSAPHEEEQPAGASGKGKRPAGAALLKSLSKKGVAPPREAAVKEHMKKAKPKHHPAAPVVAAPAPPRASGGGSAHPTINGVGGLKDPPIPGGLARLPQQPRTGGAGDRGDVHEGVSGPWSVQKRSRSAADSERLPFNPQGRGVSLPPQLAGGAPRAAKMLQPQVERKAPPAATPATPTSPKPKSKPKPAAAAKTAAKAALPSAPAPTPAPSKPSLPAHPLARILLVIEKLLEHPDSGPFDHPISSEEAPDYDSYVKTPMDLGTIADRLRPGLESGWGTVRYKSILDVMSDVAQIWKNCHTYNEDTAPVIILCDELEGLFKEHCAEFKIPLDAYLKSREEKGKKRKYQASKGKVMEQADKPAPKKRKEKALQPVLQKTAPRPPARIPNNKARNQAKEAMLPPPPPPPVVELDEGGGEASGRGLEVMAGDGLFEGFYGSGSKCEVCVRARKGRCGTASAPLKCERRAQNGLPTYEDVKAGRVQMNPDGSIIGVPARKVSEASDGHRGPGRPPAAARRSAEEVYAEQQRLAELRARQQAEVERAEQERQRRQAEAAEAQRAAAAAAARRMPEEQIKARLVQAATMQQEAAAEKLKVRSQRAAQAKASAEHAYKVLLAAKRTVMEVDAALHSRQEAMLSGAAATAPDGSPLVDPTTYQPRTFSGSMLHGLGPPSVARLAPGILPSGSPGHPRPPPSG